MVGLMKVLKNWVNVATFFIMAISLSIMRFRGMNMARFRETALRLGRQKQMS